MKKCLNLPGLEPATYQTWNWCLRRHGYWGLIKNVWIFDDVKSVSLCSEFGKAELYLIGSCQDEWLEATYYIYPWVLVSMDQFLGQKLQSLVLLCLYFDQVPAYLLTWILVPYHQMKFHIYLHRGNSIVWKYVIMKYCISYGNSGFGVFEEGIQN